MKTRTRILLVDDDEVDFVITSKLLAQVESSEYEVDWAECYEEGVRLLAHERYDVCLVDYRLGDRSGLDLLRVAGARGCPVPIILLTGQGDERVDAQALALGAAGYLDKGRLDVDVLDRALRYAQAREGLVTDLIDHNEELLRLHRFTEILLSSDPIPRRLLQATAQFARATNFPVALLERIDLAGATVRTLATWGLDPEDRPPAIRRREESPARRAMESRRPTVVMDFDGGPNELGRSGWPWARSMVALPLSDVGELLGAITVASHEPMAVDGTQLQRAATLALHIGLLLGRMEREAGLTSAS